MAKKKRLFLSRMAENIARAEDAKARVRTAAALTEAEAYAFNAQDSVAGCRIRRAGRKLDMNVRMIEAESYYYKLYTSYENLLNRNKSRYINDSILYLNPGISGLDEIKTMLGTPMDLPLPSNKMVVFTGERYYSVAGMSGDYFKKGVDPDIRVIQTKKNIFNDNDLFLQKAVSFFVND